MAYTLRRRERADPDKIRATGSFTHEQVSATPGVVGAPGLLAFDTSFVGYKVIIYEIAEAVVPNWFVVGIPSRLVTPSHIHIFFHPLPGQAGYNDAAYPAKTQKWPGLIRYAHSLGAQSAIDDRDIISIMPMFTNGAAGTCGIFPANWSQIVDDIVADLAVQESLIPPPRGRYSSLTISSFSAGIKYSDVFRRTALGLASRMTAIVDFDGFLSNDYRHISRALSGTEDVQVVLYDQRGSAASPTSLKPNTEIFHCPSPRWRNHTPRVTDPVTEVHGMFPIRLWRHAAERLELG
jgi:hypothetical protein